MAAGDPRMVARLIIQILLSDAVVQFLQLGGLKVDLGGLELDPGDLETDVHQAAQYGNGNHDDSGAASSGLDSAQLGGLVGCPGLDLAEGLDGSLVGHGHSL